MAARPRTMRILRSMGMDVSGSVGARGGGRDGEKLPACSGTNMRIRADPRPQPRSLDELEAFGLLPPRGLGDDDELACREPGLDHNRPVGCVAEPNSALTGLAAVHDEELALHVG